MCLVFLCNFVIRCINVHTLLSVILPAIIAYVLTIMVTLMNKTRENPATATSRNAENKTRAIKAVNVITKATIATNMAFIFIF